ncbi:MAG: hypothetical protein R3B95_14260 [Nitrospirales bacterium]|nr:hypothetical protein [Nitrospirales bacterium]
MTRRLNRIPHATDEKGAVTWFVGLGLGIIMASLAVAGGGDIEKGKTFYRQS